jgi:hypothetical protein
MARGRGRKGCMDTGIPRSLDRIFRVACGMFPIPGRAGAGAGLGALPILMTPRAAVCCPRTPNG